MKRFRLMVLERPLVKLPRPRTFPSTIAIPILVSSLSFALSGTTVAADRPDTTVVVGRSGFDAPIRILPEVGLWVDGLTELGGLKKTGLVLWWGFDTPAPETRTPKARVEWTRVPFRIRAQVVRADGHVMDREEKLVDPLRPDSYMESGGFPAPLHLSVKPGVYRVKLEAYPLISASDAGLDSVPHGRAETQATIPDNAHRSHGWKVGDPMFVGGLRKWAPGAAPERTWYEWVIQPNAARGVLADTTLDYLAFEVTRSEEAVPHCGSNSCRIVITVTDKDGGVALQELRPVPPPATSNAYLVPFRSSDLAPGAYTVTVEVYEADQLQISVSRTFQVLPVSPTASSG